ncbi:MAG: redoxin family protein [Minisyncoccia bacterium]
MILFLLSFIAGVLTVLAPCTLPLLPVIVGSSVSGEASKKKAIVITASLGVSIILFTLLLKVSTVFINIPQEIWSVVSGFIIIIFGIFTIAPEIWEDFSFVGKLSVSSNKLLGLGYKKNNFLGDIIIGVALGPVFSSCSPTYFIILASVLPKSFLVGLIDLAFYAIGLSGTLLLIAFLGQRIVSKIGGLSDTHGWFRRSLGAIFIIVGVAVIFGFDKKLQTKLLDFGLFDITKVEQTLLKLSEDEESNFSSIATSTVILNSEKDDNSSDNPIQKTRGPKAPQIQNPNGFINTNDKPITLSEFKGKKVVLLDIWTYSCINCQRTLPYVQGWYEKYKDKGFVVIGLHTPEFAFEKVKSNVEDATKKFGLTYPIVMDNDYSTWTAYGNRYWPRKYLISGDGEIVYDHIGEGNYEETERAIQRAIYELNGGEMEDGMIEPGNVISYDPKRVKSPEVYFGANRNEYLANGKSKVLGVQTLTLPAILFKNLLYLDGSWNFFSEYVMSNTDGKVLFKYDSKSVYMVANSDRGGDVVVYKDGKKERVIHVKNNQLYTLVDGDNYGEHLLELIIPSGVNIFTFTFG